MKKTFLILLIFLFCRTAFTQIYLGAGYNLTFVKINQLNNVIDRYNNTRTSLTKKMDYVNMPGGVNIQFGIFAKPIHFGISWVGHNQTVSAIENYGSGDVIRELKFRNNSFNIDFGIIPYKSENFPMSIGFSIDFGNTKMFTRVGDPYKIDDVEFEKICNTFFIGNSIFFHFMIRPLRFLAIGIKPYIQFPYISLNYSDVNEAINPTSYNQDPYEMKSLAINYGVQFMLLFTSKKNFNK